MQTGCRNNRFQVIEEIPAVDPKRMEPSGDILPRAADGRAVVLLKLWAALHSLQGSRQISVTQRRKKKRRKQFVNDD